MAGQGRHTDQWLRRLAVDTVIYKLDSNDAVRRHWSAEPSICLLVQKTEDSERCDKNVKLLKLSQAAAGLPRGQSVENCI
jgi:hypothetical protein